MKFLINPILKKDIKVSSRSYKLSLSLLGYSLSNLFVFIIMILIFNGAIRVGNMNINRMLMYVFPVLGIMQTVMVVFTVPTITASSISGEKERQTFDLMMTTSMSPFSIVTGKLMSGISTILLFVFSCVPIMSISFIMGGVRWGNLILFLLNIVILTIFIGSIGIFCSSVSRKTAGANILTYLFFFLFCVLPFIPRIIVNSVFTFITYKYNYLGHSNTISLAETLSGKYANLAHLINPVVYFEEFYSKILFGTSIFSGDNLELYTRGVIQTVNYYGLDLPLKFITYGPVWSIVSAILLLFISYLFLRASAYIISPVHMRKKKNKKK